MEDSFSSKINAVPLSESQRESKKYSDLAGYKRLEKYGDFVTLDNLVKIYSVYTHDDIYNMEVSLVYNMVLLNKESQYLESRAQDIQRKLTKKT